MILFAQSKFGNYYAVSSQKEITNEEKEKLAWLFNGTIIESNQLDGFYIGPRKEMITPWSTNAVEITQNMGIEGILRIEEFYKADHESAAHDPMLQRVYAGVGQDIFDIHLTPEPVKSIEDIAAYNKAEGLALSDDEVQYLEKVAQRIGRSLTDSEVFGFSQVNSEHCRHKIFNGQFVINEEVKPSSLFQMIKKTTQNFPGKVISAYKDNVAFIKGPNVEQFAPASGNKADYFRTTRYNSVLSLKAETHNFPTTVEPFNGAATGAGGEIRDRMAGGKGSLPMAGTAVYMTSYSRLADNRPWENGMEARPWLYQTPMDILIKASNGASDFGNKFGQPLICGSVLTFEHQENDVRYGFDKVIMLAGGIGQGKESEALKEEAKPGQKIVVMGGDNYRIGMGGGAVSSVATGEFSNAIELNAVQRSNPEMQKRVANALRTLVESDKNPIVSIHDHGAGGHLNCLSELVEATGGVIDLHALPVGDPTLSYKEIIGNESQERMGLLMEEKDIEELKEISARERAPMYVVGETSGDMNFKFEDKKQQQHPINIRLEDMFGKPPRTIMKDERVSVKYQNVKTNEKEIYNYIESVLRLEAVACKDWLTNKVDRSVTGKIAHQQTAGELQLPLNNLGAVALDYRGVRGIATSIGHAPVIAMADPVTGSRMAVAESLTNLVWAPIEGNLSGVSLSANWMWPCKNKGEDARLYDAVEAVSEFCIALGVNVPTGKDSLSMTQKYKDGLVYAPGTVIISAIGEALDVRSIVSPVLKKEIDTTLLYIDFSHDDMKLGGSSLAQVMNKIGMDVPTIRDASHFKSAFNAIQELIRQKLVLAGHDVSSGGLITTLLEMNFANTTHGIRADVSKWYEKDIVKILFAENSGVVIQVRDTERVKKILAQHQVGVWDLGKVVEDHKIDIQHGKNLITFDVTHLRNIWFETSYLLDRRQSGEVCAESRFRHLNNQPVVFSIPETFTGTMGDLKLSADRQPSGLKAAIIREKGSNGDREMAYSLYLAGFDVKDVHMTDLMSGRETLEDIQFIVFVGGFSNSDVLGSAKGWAGAFRYNENAMNALKNFYARPDTMSLGVCNGCQLMAELGLIYPEMPGSVEMHHNISHKFESCFVGVTIQDTNSVMLQGMDGMQLGIWVAHGEGKFHMPLEENNYSIALKYTYSNYPANPNGSAYNTAGLVSKDGRHLAMMPHLERAIFTWQNPYYPENKRNEELTPWIKAFVNAKEWIEAQVEKV